MARLTIYKPEFLKIAREYIDSCEKEVEEFHKTRGHQSDSYERIIKPNIPTVAGLAIKLGLNKKTLYQWAKTNEELSNLLDDLLDKQEEMLLQGGLSNDYNANIAKLILSARHEYREKSDMTTDGKPIMVTFDDAFNTSK